MNIDKLRQRLSTRKMIAITLQIPEDIIDDLQRVAPLRGFSNYLPLMLAYIGQGLREDLARLDEQPELSGLIESLRRHGVADDVIASAIADVKPVTDPA
jgi:hypothetical protein